MKTDIADIADALSLVSQLDGRSYQWREDAELSVSDAEGRVGNGERALGFIAQELRAVIPEVVHEDPRTGILSVSYADMVPILVEAMKAHQQRAEEISSRQADELQHIRDEFMSSSDKIRVTLRRLKKIRKARAENGASSAGEKRFSKEWKHTRSSPFFSAIPCGFSRNCMKAPAIAVGVVAVIATIILIAALASTTGRVSPTPAAPGPIRPGPPSTFKWYNRNWITNGNFDAYGAQLPGVTAKVAFLHTYDDNTTFPLVNNASSYFNAGFGAARLTINASALKDPNLWSPEYVSVPLNIGYILQTYAGFTNASSGVTGLQIAFWFNWIYAQDPPQYYSPLRTSERIFVQVDSYFSVNSAMPESSQISYVPGIEYKAYKGWQQFSTTILFDPERYPENVDIRFSSSLLGSVFFDSLYTSFVRAPGATFPDTPVDDSGWNSANFTSPAATFM